MFTTRCRSTTVQRLLSRSLRQQQLSTFIRRTHVSTSSSSSSATSASSSTLLRSVSIAACTAAIGAFFYHTHQIAACENKKPVESVVSASSSTSSAQEEIKYYKQTESKLATLPHTPSEISQYSHDQLAAIYDPEGAGDLVTPLAHGVVWGTPPPPSSLAPIELMFTADDTDPTHRHLELLVRTIQDRICNNLLDIEQLGGATIDSIDGIELNEKLRALLLAQTTVPGQFREDITIRPGGTGGGITRILQGGRVFAKAGVSVSVANVKPPAQSLARLAIDHPSLKEYINGKEPYTQWTAAVSMVLHPVSPNVPTMHANYRFFDITLPDGKKIWWFGGGSDLTPSYVNDEDATHFHKLLKSSLNKFDESYYPSWKKWADQYFVVKHRGETRGVGGVFFDDLHQQPYEHYESVVRRLGEALPAQYFPIVMKRKDEKFTESDLAYQQLRRGRYIEFNLVYDKGTTYGLQMVHSRPDAVLMSLPPIARFDYKQPIVSEKEIYTNQVVTKPKDWC